MTHNYYQRHIKPTDAHVGMLLIITYNWNAQMTDSQIRFKVKVLITLPFCFVFSFMVSRGKKIQYLNFISR